MYRVYLQPTNLWMVERYVTTITLLEFERGPGVLYLKAHRAKTSRRSVHRSTVLELSIFQDNRWSFLDERRRGVTRVTHWRWGVVNATLVQAAHPSDLSHSNTLYHDVRLNRYTTTGGNFIWPGVQEGHVQTVRGLQELGSIEIKTLSMQPLV